MPRSTHLTAPALAAAVALVASAIAAPAASQVVTSAGGEVVSTAQKHMVDHLITTDSIQAEAARFASTKTENASVREFANQLATDHSAHVTSLQTIAAKPNIGREHNPDDTENEQVVTRFTTLQTTPAGAEFDRKFLQDVISNHESELASIKAAKASMRDEELKKDLDKHESGLQEHLTKAKELLNKLDKGK